MSYKKPDSKMERDKNSSMLLPPHDMPNTEIAQLAGREPSALNERVCEAQRGEDGAPASKFTPNNEMVMTFVLASQWMPEVKFAEFCKNQGVDPMWVEEWRGEYHPLVKSQDPDEFEKPVGDNRKLAARCAKQDKIISKLNKKIDELEVLLDLSKKARAFREKRED